MVSPAVPSRSAGRSERSRRRREQKKRRREVRRVILAAVFLGLQLAGFSLANFASRDSWSELAGFLLLQPAQIFLNLLDSRFQLTRGLRDADAVLLVTLLSLPLNVVLWYGVWRAWRKLRRLRRKRRRATASAYGAALGSFAATPGSRETTGHAGSPIAQASKETALRE